MGCSGHCSLYSIFFTAEPHYLAVVQLGRVDSRCQWWVLTGVDNSGQPHPLSAVVSSVVGATPRHVQLKWYSGLLFGGEKYLLILFLHENKELFCSHNTTEGSQSEPQASCGRGQSQENGRERATAWDTVKRQQRPSSSGATRDYSK